MLTTSAAEERITALEQQVQELWMIEKDNARAKKKLLALSISTLIAEIALLMLLLLR